MWKSRKDDPKPYTPPNPPAPMAPAVTATAIPAREVRPLENPKMENYRSDVAHIGKSVIVKGELSGSEDLYLDGEVEGTIELSGNSLTVGPNGRVRANTNAKDIIVHGKVNGNLRADRVELKKSALVTGDIITQRVVIEDGAFFKGGIDIQREQAKETPRVDPRPAPMATSAAASIGSPHPSMQ